MESKGNRQPPQLSTEQVWEFYVASYWSISSLHKVNEGAQQEHYPVLIIQLMPASTRVLSLLRAELGWKKHQHPLDARAGYIKHGCGKLLPATGIFVLTTDEGLVFQA